MDREGGQLKIALQATDLRDVRSIGFVLLRLAELLIIGLLCVSLARYAPGFDVDEREWDSRLSAASIESIQAERHEQSNVIGYYSRYLQRAIRGDLGMSLSFGTDVAELIGQRLPTTFTIVTSGWLFGSVMAALLAATVVWLRLPWLSATATVFSTAGLGLPAALLGLSALLLGVSPWLALAVYVTPRCFEMFVRLLESTAGSAALLAAKARGVGPFRMWVVYWLPSAAAPLAAVSALTFSAAFGAAVPVEVITDTPGLGQLAWKAALGRDVPLLLGVTFIVGAMTLVSNSLAELAQVEKAA